jgi:hypothetical protein
MSSTRSRHSLGGKHRLGEDPIAELRFECGTGHELDPSSNALAQLALQAHELEDPDRPGELDEHVDVALSGRASSRANEPNSDTCATPNESNNGFAFRSAARISSRRGTVAVLTGTILRAPRINNLRGFFCGQIVDNRRARLCRNPNESACSCMQPIRAVWSVYVVIAQPERVAFRARSQRGGREFEPPAVHQIP